MKYNVQQHKANQDIANTINKLNAANGIDSRISARDVAAVAAAYEITPTEPSTASPTTVKENTESAKKAYSLQPIGIRAAYDDTWKKGWFKKGEGNFFQNTGATIGDALTDLTTGIVNIPELLTDAFVTLASLNSEQQLLKSANSQAMANSVLGKSENNEGLYEEAIKQGQKTKEVGAEFVKKDLYDADKVTKKAINAPVKLFGGDINWDRMEANSVFDYKTDSLMQSSGQLVATAGMQAVGVPFWVTTGLMSFGGESENALQQGATLEEATLSGLITAAGEVLTEKISGGIKFGGKALDDVLTDALAKNISDKFARTALRLGLDMAGEGFEEVLSQDISTFGQWLTYQDEESLKELLWSEEAMDAKIEAFLGGAALGGTSGSFKTVKSNLADLKSGTQAAKDGSAKSILEKAKQITEAENKNNTGYATFKNVKTAYEQLSQSLEKTNGEISTIRQKALLGQLKQETVRAQLMPYIERSAEKIVQNAELVAQKYSEFGFKDANGKPITVTPEAILSGIDVNADRATYIKQLRNALTTNSVLSTLAVIDATGHIKMNTAKFAEATLKGENLADQSDLEYFVEYATETEKATVGKALGIQDWNTISIDQFRNKAADFALRGKAQSQAKIDSIPTINPEKNASLNGESANINAESANLNNDHITIEEFSNRENNKKALPGDENSRSGKGEATEAKSMTVIESATFAKENIPEYAELNADDQARVRRLIRQAKASGFTDAQTRAYARVSARSGIDIVFDKERLYRGNGEYADGLYSLEQNKIFVNPEGSRSPARLLIHELTHALYNDRQSRVILDRGAKNLTEDQKKKIWNRYFPDAEYNENNIIFKDELSSRYTEALLDDDALLEKLCNDNPTLKDKILSFFKKAITGYSDEPNLSREAKKLYKRYKTLFDRFSERNQYGEVKGEGERYAYAGEKARTADKLKLDTAKDMLDNGIDSETVRKETGWFKGYDGEWRFEISDFESSLIENPDLKKNTDDGEVYFTGKLSDIFDHKELFEAYPELKDINIIIQKTNFGVEGIYQPNSNYITLSIEQFKRYTKKYYDFLNGERKAEIAKIEESPEYKEMDRYYDDEVSESMEPEQWLKEEQIARDKFYSSEIGKRYYQLKWGKEPFVGEKFEFGWDKGAKEVLLHELQHAVQKIEGFTSGTNTNNKNYDVTAGEIEARDTANRANLTAEQRKNTRPDIDRTDVVFAEKSTENAKKVSKKVSTNSGDRMALPDTDYLDAVNRGDMETAQRMVDEAAKEAGYTKKVYHGSHTRFTVFSHKESGGLFNFAENKQAAQSYAFGGGGNRGGDDIIVDTETYIAWEYADELDAYVPVGKANDYVESGNVELLPVPEKYKLDILPKYYVRNNMLDMEGSGRFEIIPKEANTGEFYIKTKKTLNLVTEKEVGRRVFQEIAENFEKHRSKFESLRQGEISKVLNRILWSYKNDYYDFWEITKQEYAHRAFEDYIVPELKRMGYDSIYHRDDSHKTYVVFDPEQIKSAAPVTYDDKGNVIPLSQRFNSKNDDIRFALPDEEGDILRNGTRVKANDRGNIGVITGYNSGVYSVRFTSKEGLSRTLQMTAEEFEPLKKKASAKTTASTSDAEENENPLDMSSSVGKKRQEYKASFKERIFTAADSVYIDTVDELYGVTKYLTKVGKIKDAASVVQAVRASLSAAQTMVGDVQYDIFSDDGKKLGEGLSKIIKPITVKGEKVRNSFNEYLLHWLNTDRMTLEERTNGEIKNKPVFGENEESGRTETITAEQSRKKIAELEKVHPDFKAVAEKVWAYTKNLNHMRVEAGLISSDSEAYMNELYPHYVPSNRDLSYSGVGAIKGKRNLEISSTVKRAKGGGEDIYDVFYSIALQTQEVARTGRINQLFRKMYDVAVENGDNEYVEVISKEKVSRADSAAMQSDSIEIRPKGNQITGFVNGEKVTLSVSDEIFIAFDNMSKPTVDPTSAFGKGAQRLNEIYKKLLTSYSPAFLIRNPIRDIQDAGLNSKHSILFAKNLKKAVETMLKNGEAWQIYRAYGGYSASIFGPEGFSANVDNRGFEAMAKLFDSDEVTVKTVYEAAKRSGKNLLTGINNLNAFVEQATRFAEYLASVEAGDSIPSAINNAAEVTTNFGRRGRLTKKLNATIMPFLNPSIQGFDKIFRNVTDAFKEGTPTATAKALANLLGKAAVIGLAPMLVNMLLYGDDDDYEKLREADKENNFLIKVGDTFIKIPRGRLASVIGGTANRGSKLIKGEDADLKDYAENVINQVTPVGNLTRTILSPFFDVKNNRTWYGGEIEGRQFDNTAPKDRYDESTSSWAIAIGKIINYSPKKIHYLLDQYSGVIGDFVLPATSKKASKDFFSGNFTIDPATSNKLSTSFYKIYDKAQYAKTAGDDTAIYQVKYLNKVKDAISDMYDKKSEIQNNSELSNVEKLQQSRVVQILINQAYETALADIDRYTQAFKATEGIESTSLFKSAFGTEATEATVQKMRYTEATRYMYGAKKALEEYDDAVYAKCELLNLAGVDYDKLYNYYFSTKGLTSDTDKKGNVINGSKRKKVISAINALGVSREQRLLLIASKGYSLTGSEKKRLLSYILKLKITKENRIELAELCGFTVRNGKIVADFK